MNNKTYHWSPLQAMWTVHNPEDFEMGKTGKDKTLDSKTQEEGEK